MQSLRAATAGYQDLEAHDAGPDTDEALRPRPRVRENILAVARAEVRLFLRNRTAVVNSGNRLPR